MLKQSLAPTEERREDSKKSEGENKSRKESKMSEGHTTLGPQAPRKKFDKKVLLARFKTTREMNLNVFEQQSMLDNCDLIITSDSKPKAAIKLESLEDSDDELEPDDSKVRGNPGQPPENLKPTQEKPNHALQQYQRPGKGPSRGGF